MRVDRRRFVFLGGSIGGFSYFLSVSKGHFFTPRSGGACRAFHVSLAQQDARKGVMAGQATAHDDMKFSCAG